MFFNLTIFQPLIRINNNWGNSLLRHERKSANPIGGISPWIWHRADYNNNGVLGYNTNPNTPGSTNEGKLIRREFINGQDEILYRSMGGNSTIEDYNVGPAFQVGDELNMCSNPMILNYPTFDQNADRLNPYILNGLSVKIIDTGLVAKVEVKFKETDVCDDVRWTGDIILPNITEDGGADLNLASGKTITLDLNGTANKTQFNPLTNDFVEPSSLTVSAGATLQLQSNSTILVKAHSTLIFEAGSEVLLEEGARIIVEETGTLVLNGNNIQLNGDNAALVIHGTVITADNVDFTFGGSGFVEFHQSHQLEMGTGSDFILDGVDIDNSIIVLKDNTVLNIPPARELNLSNGRIIYEDNSRIETALTTVNFNFVSLWEDEANSLNSATGLKATDVSVCNISNCTATEMKYAFDVSGFISKPVFESNEFHYCEVGIYGHQIKFNVDLSNNQFMECLEAGIRMDNVNRLNASQNVAQSCILVGYELWNVNKATLMEDLIENSQTGILGGNSNVFLTDGTTITQNQYGVVLDNSHANFTLSLGRCKCANIVNNAIVGVQGSNIILDIDGYEHQFECGQAEPLANRFDGNAMVFDICYSDPNFVPYTIPMRFNYWGGGSINELDYELRYGLEPCGAPNYMLVDDSDFVTNPALLVNCAENEPPGIANDDFPPEVFDAVFCQTETGGTEYNIHIQSQVAFQEYFQGNYENALSNYIPIAALKSDISSYSDICNQQINFANCITEALLDPDFRSGGIWWSELAEARRDLLKQQAYVLSPNPTGDYLYLLSKPQEQEETVYLVNALGEILQHTMVKEDMKIDMTNFKDGLYFLVILNEKGTVRFSEKIIKMSN